jgi:4-hydroxy-L-threonine phosphate dehydrogenase PdxA
MPSFVAISKQMAKRSALKIVITSGDRDGVGLEVACKALASLGPQSTARFLLTAHAHSFSRTNRPSYFRLLQKKFRLVEITDVPMAIASKVMVDLKANEIALLLDSSRELKTEAKWVLSAAELASKKQISALVTGPVSKERFEALDNGCIGHTGLLSRVAGRPVFQGYIGEKMSVVLATDHIPLNEIESSLTAKRLRGASDAVLQLRRLLPSKRRALPIAWLGLNPHSGEGGLIGKFEERVHKQQMLPRSFGPPLPADTAFGPEKLKSTSVYLSLYHDQGLIPFKMLHGQDSGFQISLGLPFIRTSVDHGTAKNIFGKGIANPGSMIDAISAAMMAAKNTRSIEKKK